MSRLGHAQLSLTMTIRLKPAFNLHDERESWISFAVQTELPFQIPADNDQVSEAPKCVWGVTFRAGISRNV